MDLVILLDDKWYKSWKIIMVVACLPFKRVYWVKDYNKENNRYHITKERFFRRKF